jgi:drug/metabolite transporter (DMT)-like permease
VRTTRGIHAALVLVVAMWGLVFVGIARLLPQVDAVQLVVIRFTLIALVFVGMFIVIPSTRPHITTWRDRGIFVLLGVLAVPGSQLTIVNGQRYLSPPLVSLVVTTSPAFAAIIAAVWLKERVTSRQIVGFVIALAGVAVVIVAGMGEGTALTVSNPWGAALTLLSPMCWAMYTILSKTLTSRFAPVTAVGVAMVTGSLSMLPLWPHAADGLSDITSTGWAWMAYLVVGGTVIPYLVWWRALDQLTAASTTAYMYGIPFAALVWSWLVLGIVPSFVALLGGLVIIVGVTLIQFARRESVVRSAVPSDVPT